VLVAVTAVLIVLGVPKLRAKVFPYADRRFHQFQSDLDQEYRRQ